MKLLFDFFPIALFFLSYKIYDLYVATIVIIAATLLQVVASLIKHKKIDNSKKITLFMVVLLGGATLLLRNEIFIKWKPTAIYWAFAIIFLGSQFIGSSSLLEKLMGGKVVLPKSAWKTLNISWILFFAIMGAVNLFVAYNFNTDTWVNFKLFGFLGSTLVFVILQSIYMGKYLKNSIE